jgi:hypothetical protein
MKHHVTRAFESIVTCLGTLLFAVAAKDGIAQDSANLPYMNPQLSPEQRATARTRLAEVLNFEARPIDHQLSHRVRDAEGTAYNRTSFLAVRREMMRRWCDYLDELKTRIPN